MAIIEVKNYRRRLASTYSKKLPTRDQTQPRNVLGCQVSPCSALHAPHKSLSAAVYDFFNVSVILNDLENELENY